MQNIEFENAAKPRWVKVMADYLSSGLWDSEGIHAEPDFVPMSPQLSERLEAWCLWYEKSDLPAPMEPFDYAAFSTEGLAIAHALKAELPDWTVVYFDEAKLMETMRAGAKERSYFEYEVMAE